MSYNISDINKLKSQIKQYYSFIKNDGMILTNFAKYLLTKTDMNLEQAIINLKEMSIKDIQTKLYDLTLELNTQTEISDIIKNKIDEENKKLKDIVKRINKYKEDILKYKIDTDIQINKNLEEEYEMLKDTEDKKIYKLKEEYEKLKDTNEKELSDIKNAIDGIYRNEIYDNEYTFEELKYIKKYNIYNEDRKKDYRIIELDIDKILKDSKNNCCTINNNIESLKYNCITNTICGINTKLGYWHICEQYKDRNINFPIIDNLMNKEYIIKLILTKNTNEDICYDILNMLYITNYGRIIKSSTIIFVDSVTEEELDNQIEYIYDDLNYDIIEQPKLNYRIPRLFIDVIDAFHTQNTDLMQECCKKYLEISRESKIKDSILKDLELNNKLKEKDNIIKSKDLELEDKNKVIESQLEEINKLKDELTKFKQSLSMLINK